MADAPTRITSYPHVDGVQDWRAAQSLKLLWDQVTALQGRMSTAEAKLVDLDAQAADQQQAITTTDRKADEALSIAQLYGGTAQGPAGGTGGGSGGSGGGGGGDTSMPPGTIPIVPMSSDPVVAEDQVKRSLAYFGRTDYSYWGPLVHIPGMEPWGPATDGNWYIGWDAYMEARAAPGAGDSADPALLPLPAVHQDPVPPGYPPGGWT